MRFDQGRFQHDEAEVLVNADIRIEEPLHQRLILFDSGGDEFYEIVVASRNQMALDHLIDLLDRSKKSREVELTVVLQSDFGEHRQRLAQFSDIDLGRITLDIALRL